jgi:CBS domain-containing protein
MELNDTARAVLEYKGGWVCYVSPETSVYDALEIMAEEDIGALLVISGSHLCGIISERDYSRKVALLGKSSKETAVGEIMTSPPLVVGPAESVDSCLKAMTQYRIRHLPVVEDDAVIGVLSIGDLVNWVIRRQVEEIQHLNHYIAGSYPA